VSQRPEDDAIVEINDAQARQDTFAGEAHAASDAREEIATHPDFIELQDRYLRQAAEYDNYRKRTAREWQEHRQRATAEILREMLELADNLERALQAPTDDATGLRKGVELIWQQLQAKLRRFGVEPIAVHDQEFDPKRHEAVLAVDTDAVPSHWVVDEVQRGYTLNGEVLRPAKVTVAR
jgi:molecular chaperone GrpE